MPSHRARAFAGLGVALPLLLVGCSDLGTSDSCVDNVECTTDARFDRSVCACVPVKPPVCGTTCDIYCPYGNVRDANGCATCECNPPPDPCANVTCAGGTHCDSGACVADPISCGGLDFGPCPGLGKCVDDPRDSCPSGAVDCPGICSCVQNMTCRVDTLFDSSPVVCNCVPFDTTCPWQKCPTPVPPAVICADGSIGGATCAPDDSGACAWTIIRCPAVTPAAP